MATKVTLQTMKFNQPLNDILGQQSKVKILRFLVNAGVESAGREIARSVRITQRITHSALMDLWKQGIVSMRRVGKAKLYKINKENIFASKALMPLFAFEGKLLTQMIAPIIQKIKKHLLSIIIFGSVAKGDEQPNSDIDLLIILKEEANLREIESALDELSITISRKLGNFLSPILLKEKRFRSRYNQKDKFIRNIVENGRAIYGKTFMEMIYA